MAEIGTEELKPTCYFRFKENTLQQWWENSYHKGEWREIPICWENTPDDKFEFADIGGL